MADSIDELNIKDKLFSRKHNVVYVYVEIHLESLLESGD